ncbi:hypothetical protein ACX0G7_09785 [Flavitalea antarctica]
MTLKTLLKNAGVPKIRGLEAKIEKWSYEDRQPTIKWYEDWIKENNAKMEVLSKLNTELQEQHKADLETIQKMKDEIQAAKVKQQFTDSQKELLKKKIEELETALEVSQELILIKSKRIDNYDNFVAEFKAGKVGM